MTKILFGVVALVAFTVGGFFVYQQTTPDCETCKDLSPTSTATVDGEGSCCAGGCCCESSTLTAKSSCCSGDSCCSSTTTVAKKSCCEGGSCCSTSTSTSVEDGVMIAMPCGCIKSANEAENVVCEKCSQQK